MMIFRLAMILMLALGFGAVLWGIQWTLYRRQRYLLSLTEAGPSILRGGLILVALGSLGLAVSAVIAWIS
jgi:hypothetical protein